jgi:hypothetical protein
MLAAGCFYSNALGGLKCYENPKNKVTAVPANEEEICAEQVSRYTNTSASFCCPNENVLLPWFVRFASVGR